MIRHQLPVFSPLPLRALIGSALSRTQGAGSALRDALRQGFGVEDALLCGSGTQALQLALQASRGAGRSRGEVVALPAFACYDLASAAIGADVQVGFYDIDPDTLLPDMDSLTRVLAREPAAVVIAPLFGYQPDWDAIRSLARRHDVGLIEDAAQSFGALWKGEPSGGIGDLSVLSFGRGKGWTAVEGGALLGPERELVSLSESVALGRPGAKAASRILLQGFAQWALGRPLFYGLPSAVPGLELGETVYHAPVAPSFASPLSARLALQTLEISRREATARRARAREMVARIEAERNGGIRVPAAHGRSEPGNLRLPLLASPAARRHLLARGRVLGVMPSYPRPLPELPSLKPHIAEEATFPGARALAERLVTLPTHSLLTESDMSRIVQLVRATDG